MKRDPVPSPWMVTASFVCPTLVSLLLSGNGWGFLDCPELASAGAGLGVTHPPGHPLFVLLASLSRLIPVGAVPLRLIVLQALLLGACGRVAFLLCRKACLTIVAPDDEEPPHLLDLASLAASMTAVLGPAVMRQGTRVEVYALALLPVCLVLSLSMPDDNTEVSRSLHRAFVRARIACVIFGLGLANHHFIMATAGPVLCVALWPIARAPAARWLDRLVRVGSTVVFVLPGLLLYALLPMRARAPASWPRPESLREILDVASARTFAKGLTGSIEPFFDRLLDVFDWINRSLSPFGVVLAVGGIYVIARTRNGLPLAWRALLLFVTVVVARAILGLSRDNPDAAGYIAPAVLVLALPAAAFVCVIAEAIRKAPAAPKGPTVPARWVLTVILVGGPSLLPGLAAWNSYRESSIDRGTAAETLGLSVLNALPPRAVLVAYDPGTIFRVGHAMVTEGERPDVLMIPEPLLGYPGMIPHLLERDAGLVSMFARYTLRPEQGLALREIAAVTRRRRVFIEGDPRNVQPMVNYLLPSGLCSEVMSEPTNLGRVRGVSNAHWSQVDRVIAALKRDETQEQDAVRDVLLWHDYTDALFFAQRGAREQASESVRRGLVRAPESRELNLMQQVLGQGGEGPLDISPFLP